jgi:hypothetical protein
METKRSEIAFKFWRVPTLTFLILSSACAQSAAVILAPLLSQNKAEFIRELESAKKLDWTNAFDPNVAPVTREDFVDRMNKADRAINELTHGFEVPQSELDEALWIPPKSLSPTQRAELIRQLQAASQQNTHNEQAMLNDLVWSKSVAPADTVKFDQQLALANSVIKDLEIDEGVHCSTITEAMQVSQSPY